MRETRSQIQSRDKDMLIDDAPGMTCAKCGGKRLVGRACGRNECAVKAFLSTKEFSSLYDSLLKEFDADLCALDVEKESDEMRIESISSNKKASEEKLDIDGEIELKPQPNDAPKPAAAEEMEIEGASDKPVESTANKIDTSDAIASAMNEFAELKAASPNLSPLVTRKSTAKPTPQPSKSANELRAVNVPVARKCVRLPPDVVANFLSDVEFTTEDVFYNIDAAIGSFVFQVSAQTGARVIGLETDARMHDLSVKMRERFVKAIPEDSGVKIDVTLIHAHPFGDLPKRVLRGATVVFVNNLDYSVAKTRALLHFLEKHLEDDARLIALKDLYQYSGELIGPNHPMRIFAYPWKYHTVMSKPVAESDATTEAYTYYIYVVNRKQLKPLTNLSCGLSLRLPGDSAKRMDGLNSGLRGSYVNTRFLEEIHAQKEYAFPGLLESFMLRAYGPSNLLTESESTATEHSESSVVDQPLTADSSLATLPARATISPQQAHEMRAGGSDASRPQTLSVFAQEAVFRKSRYLVRQKQEIEKLEIERQLNQQLQAQKELDRAVQLQAKQSSAELKLLKQQAQQAAQQEATAKQQAQQAQAQQQQEQHALLYSHLYPQFPLSAYPHQVSSYTSAMNQSYSQYSHLQHMQHLHLQQSQHMQAPTMPHSLTHLHLAPQGTTQQQQQQVQAHAQAQVQSAQQAQQQQAVQQQQQQAQLATQAQQAQQAQQQATQQQQAQGQAGQAQANSQAQQQAAQQSALQYAQLIQLQPGVNQFGVPTGVGLPAPYGSPGVQAYGQYPAQGYPAQYSVGVGSVQMGQLSVGQYPHPSQYPVVGYPPAQAYATGLPPYGAPSVVGGQVGYPPAQAYGQYPAPYGAVPTYTQPQQQLAATNPATQQAATNASAPTTAGPSQPSPTTGTHTSVGATPLLQQQQQATGGGGASTSNAATATSTTQSNATGSTNAKSNLANSATSGAKGKASNLTNSNNTATTHANNNNSNNGNANSALLQQTSPRAANAPTSPPIDPTSALGATTGKGATSHHGALGLHPTTNMTLATNPTANTTTSPPKPSNANAANQSSATTQLQQQQQAAQLQAQQQAGMQMLGMAHGPHVSPLSVTDANLSFLHQSYLTQQQMYQQQQQLLQHSLLQQQQLSQGQTVDSHGQSIGASQSNTSTSSTHRESQPSLQPTGKSATTKSNRAHSRSSHAAQQQHNQQQATAQQQQQSQGQATTHSQQQTTIAQQQPVSHAPLQAVPHQQPLLPQATLTASHASHEDPHSLHVAPSQHGHATDHHEQQMKQQQQVAMLQQQALHQQQQHQQQHQAEPFPSEALPGPYPPSADVLTEPALAHQDYAQHEAYQQPHSKTGVHWEKPASGNNFNSNNNNANAVTGASPYKTGSSTLVIRGGLAGSLSRSTETESKRKASVGELDAPSLAPPSATQATQQPAASKRIKLSVSSESLHANPPSVANASVSDSSAFTGGEFLNAAGGGEEQVESMVVEGDPNATQHAANTTISLSLSGAKKPGEGGDQSPQAGNQPKSNAIKIRIVK